MSFLKPSSFSFCVEQLDDNSSVLSVCSSLYIVRGPEHRSFHSSTTCIIPSAVLGPEHMRVNHMHVMSPKIQWEEGTQKKYYILKEIRKVRGAAAENVRVRERRGNRSVQGLRVMLRLSWGMVLSGGIMAAMQKIESRKGRVCIKRPPGQCHRGADETG